MFERIQDRKQWPEVNVRPRTNPSVLVTKPKPKFKSEPEPAPADPSVENRCYTVKDIQIMLGISRPSAYELIRRNEFAAFRIGKGTYRIVRDSFDKWLASQTISDD